MLVHLASCLDFFLRLAAICSSTFLSLFVCGEAIGTIDTQIEYHLICAVVPEFVIFHNIII